MVGRHRKPDTTIDWPAVLAEAQAAGLSVKQLAEKLGCNRTHVARKELATGIRLKRLVENPEKRGTPLFDWPAVLTEARDKGFNTNQVAIHLGVTAASVRLAQARTGIQLPKGRANYRNKQVVVAHPVDGERTGGRAHLPDLENDWPAVLAEAREAGASAAEVAADLNVSRTHVQKNELRTGIQLPRRHKGGRKPLFEWELVLADAARDDLNAYQLSEKLGVSSAAVRKAELRTGITLPKGRTSRSQD
ncbi:hypothetical protein [Rhizobium flavescens]|uniref:hypothetical protein n=1 Tax=Rhizobium flavescens TaxID=2607407 RepID=UPI00140844CD|nr:hypothetical protein [Rhizobium flavescens]